MCIEELSAFSFVSCTGWLNCFTLSKRVEPPTWFAFGTCYMLLKLAVSSGSCCMWPVISKPTCLQSWMFRKLSTESQNNCIKIPSWVFNVLVPFGDSESGNCLELCKTFYVLRACWRCFSRNRIKVKFSFLFSYFLQSCFLIFHMLNF